MCPLSNSVSTSLVIRQGNDVVGVVPKTLILPSQVGRCLRRATSQTAQCDEVDITSAISAPRQADPTKCSLAQILCRGLGLGPRENQRIALEPISSFSR